MLKALRYVVFVPTAERGGTMLCADVLNRFLNECEMQRSI